MPNQIVLTTPPKGNFLEGYITGTPKPGQFVQIDAAVEPIGGRFTWEPYAPGTDGHQRLVAILREDDLQGRTVDDAYVTGSRCFMYCPIPGDMLMALIANIAGTPDSFAIGDILIIDTGTGKLIATTGSPESEPFMMMETVSTALTADTLKKVMFTGY